MKIALINFAGNVGKTALAKHFFVPKMGGTRHFGIGAPTSDGGVSRAEVTTARLNEFAAQFHEYSDEANVLIDFDSRSTAEALAWFKQMHSFVKAIDLWVLPITKGAKQINDTLTTFYKLAECGVLANRILLIPNNVEDGWATESQVASINRMVQYGAFVSNHWIPNIPSFDSGWEAPECIYDLPSGLPTVDSLKEFLDAAWEEISSRDRSVNAIYAPPKN